MATQATGSFFAQAPDTVKAWTECAKAAGIRTMWLGNWPYMESGSRLGQKQFILFRSLRKRHPIQHFSARKFGLEDKIARARKIANESEHLQEHLRAILEGKVGGTGYFAPLREQQMEILQAPHSPPLQGPANVDEAPVNCTLINLLKALHEITPDREHEWRYSKAHLNAVFESSLLQGGKVERLVTAIPPSLMASCSTPNNFSSR